MNNYLISLRKNLGVILLFVFVIGFLFWPVLFGGKIFVDKFAAMYHYPIGKFFTETLRGQESFPLLMPGYLSGFPVYLSQVGFYHPLYIILSEIFNFISAYNWTIILNFLAGAFATYLLARNLKLSKASSIVVSFAYALNQSNIGAGQLMGFAILIPILPLLFLSILKISQGKKFYIFAGGAVLGLGLATALSQIMLYIMVALLFFAIFLDFKTQIRANENTDQRGKLSKINSGIRFLKNFKTIWGLIISTIFGLILASPWILPVLQFKNLTHRANSNFSAENSANSVNFGDFARFFYPSFDFGGITGRASIYIGALTFFLALIAIIWLRKKGMVKFFIFLFLFTLLASFKYSPLMWIINQLPFFNLFRFPTKWMYVGSFALAFLAAFGFEYLHEIREKIAFKKLVKLIGIFTIIATTLIISANFIIVSSRSWIIEILKKYFDKHIYAKTTQAPLEYYYKVIEQKFDYIASNISIRKEQVIISLLFLVISAIFLYFYQRKGIYKNLAVAVIIINLLMVWKFDDMLNFLPKELITKPPKIAEFIKKQKPQNQPFRIYRFLPPLKPVEYIESEIIDFEADPVPKDTTYIETLEPNTHILYDIDSIDGHEVFQNKRYSRVLSLLGASNAISDGSVYNWETIENWISKKLTLEDKLKIFQSEKNRALLSMMNVKYVISPFEFPPPWKKVFETEIRKNTESQKFYVYENSDIMPRIYFANKVEFIEPDEIKAFEALMENKNFKEKTLIEISDPNLRMKSESTNDMDIQQIEIEKEYPGYLKLITNTSSPRWLVYSQNNLPNWEARIDGEMVQIHTANYVYQTIFVPKGEHTVEFKYPGPWGQFKYAIKALIIKHKK